jgi:hypothetical protein
VNHFAKIIIYYTCAVSVYAQTTETVTTSKTILTHLDYATNIPEYYLPAGTQVKVEGGWPDAFIFSSRTSFFLNTNLPAITQLSQIPSSINGWWSRLSYDQVGGSGTSRQICSYAGPIYLRLLPGQWGLTNRITIVVERDGQTNSSTSNSIVSPASAVVIPAAVVGDVNVILEQSQDGVTWTQCLPGTYNSSTVKRFFRLRAVEK